jgi:hypothetical protein
MQNSAESSNSQARTWLKTMASPSVLFFTLPWLMVLLVLGTVMQRDLGLFDAQKLYFSSWILWFGPIPLPGAYMTLGVITLCLSAKFLLYSPWRAHQAGIILSHLGVLILLIGGMVTALSQQEGYIMLREGQSGDAISDYHARVLRVEQDEKLLREIPFESLKTGEKIDIGAPFTMTVQSTCRNCRPAPVKNMNGKHGLAEQISLENEKPDQSDEANLSGLMFDVKGEGDADGTYLVMEEIPHTPEIGGYTVSLGRAQTVLPFAIELKDFKRELHPGTDVARGFSSDVVVKDGGVEWPYHIRMNEPLRYKGYTFYQASFSVRPDGEYSVLSAVQNKGRIFPYLASAIIFAGLLLHVIIRLKNASGRDA